MRPEVQSETCGFRLEDTHGNSTCGFRLQASIPFALDGSLFGRRVMVTLRNHWIGGRVPRKAQERTCHVYDYRVVLERGESTRGMKLPLELYGTDEQAAVGAWVLLEANIAPLQDAPVADPTPRAMSRSGRLRIIPQCSPYRHCAL